MPRSKRINGLQRIKSRFSPLFVRTMRAYCCLIGSSKCCTICELLSSLLRCYYIDITIVEINTFSETQRLINAICTNNACVQSPPCRLSFVTRKYFKTNVCFKIKTSLQNLSNKCHPCNHVLLKFQLVF